MGALLCTVPYAEGDLNVDPIKASYLNSIMGICELIFRIPFGMLGDWKKMNRTILLAGTFLTLGVIFLVFPMCQEYNTLMVFAGLSGIFQVITILNIFVLFQAAISTNAITITY